MVGFSGWGRGLGRSGAYASSCGEPMQQSIEKKLGGLRFCCRVSLLDGFSLSWGRANSGPCTSCHLVGSVSFFIGLEVCCFLPPPCLFIWHPSSWISTNPSRSTNVSMLVLSFRVCNVVPPPPCPFVKETACSLCWKQKNAAAPSWWSSPGMTARTPSRAL